MGRIKKSNKTVDKFNKGKFERESSCVYSMFKIMQKKLVQKSFLFIYKSFESECFYVVQMAGLKGHVYYFFTVLTKDLQNHFTYYSKLYNQNTYQQIIHFYIG